MSSMEVLAVIFAVAVIAKVIALAINPKAVLGMTDTMLKYNRISSLVCLVIAVMVATVIFANMSVIQVAAATLFFGFMFMAMLLQFPAVIKELKQELTLEKKEIWRKNWPVITIWLLLALEVLYMVFIGLPE